MTEGTSNLGTTSIDNRADPKNPAWRRTGAERKDILNSLKTWPRLAFIGALLAAVLLLVDAAPAQAAVAPSGFTATRGDTQVTLTWNNPGDNTITGYQVLQVAIDKLVVPSTITGAIEAGDRFGDSVGIAGNTAVVGAPLQESLDNQSVSITNGGWGHTFSRGSGGWSYDEFLAVSNPQVNGRLGSSVAVAGSTVMAGAPSYHQNNNTDPGEVTIASKSSLTGSLATEFTKTGQFGNDLFGRSVALDTGIAVVGAPGALIGSDALAGKAYLYTKNNNVWGPAATAIWSAGTNAGAGTIFGSSVAVDSNTVVIGSPGEDSGSGAAYVFTKTNNVWSAVRLTASDRANDDSFGRWVAVDGDFVVVGAWQDDDGGTDSGSVYVFTKPSGGWGTWVTLSTSSKAALTAKLTASDAAADDHFGWSVSVDGDNVVVGAYGNDDDGADSGSVYLFTKPSGGWVTATETVKLTAPDGAADDNFGDSVAAGGGRVIVGAPGDESETGAAYVFSIPTWSNISNSDKDTTSYTVTGLDNDVGYTFLIRPVDSGGPGPASVIKHAKPQQASAATPTNLTATAGVGKVTLSWEDPNDSTITAYKYRQKEAGGSFGQWTTIPDSAYGEANTTGYTVSNLTNGQTYTFRIRAVDEDDDTENSNDVTVTTILAAPTNLTATVGVGAGQIALDWDNPNNTLITKYQYSTDGGTSFNDITGSSATTTEYTVTGLGNGTEYTLAVRAVNASVNGEAATVTATTRLPLVPLYVSNIGQPTDTSVGADADLSSDQAQQFSTGANETGYVLGSIDVYFQRGTDSEDLTVTVWNSNTNADPGSTVHTLTNPDTIEPGLVRFTAPAQLAANTNYFVHVAFSGSGTPPRLRTTTSTNEDAGAAANWSITNYRHQAEPSSLTGWAYQSNLLKISINQVLDLPAAPANFEATGGDGHVVLSWDNPQDDYITKYQYSTDSGASYTDIALNDIDSSETEKFKYTVENLTNGTTHTFDVRAVNSAGDGAVSTKTVVMMPTAPTGFTAMPRDQRVELSWDDPGNANITKYELLKLAEESGLTADDGAKNDRFGVSVAVDGNTAVVGAFQPTYTDPDTSTVVSRPGAAYVYTKDSNGAWSQQAKLTASDGAGGDEFGISVAVDGDTVVVGARGNISKTGAIYVFTKPSDGDWTSTITETKLTATGGAADDLFGASVALYGESTIVVGAPGDQTSVGGTDVSTGSAYVFTPDSQTGEWSQNAKLTASNAGADDLFGNSVAVDVNTIAVGAYGKDGNSLTDSGLVYVFVKPEADGGWANASTETVQLRASDQAANDNFGRSVAVNGDTIVVGASGDRNAADLSTGSAYVFARPATGWASSGGTETAKLTASDGAHGDQFGRSVAVDGGTIAVGAHQNDDDGTDSGSIYVFIKPTNGWTDTTGTVKLTASNAATGDRFGIALALDGGTALVAAPRKDANDDDEDPTNHVADAGSAYVIGTLGWAKIPDDDAGNRYHEVTGLINDITYSFAVRAVNDTGDGPASIATATPMPVPAAPLNLSAAPGDGQVALTWDDPEDVTITNYQYSTDYIINGGGMGNNGGASFTDIALTTLTAIDENTSGYTVTGLANGVTHTLAVRAVNPSGEGAVSTATAVMVPAAPKLSAAPGNGLVVLSWDDPDNLTISEYQLSQSAPPEWSKITGSDATITTHTVTSLANYTAYSFQVRAVNETGIGPASNSASATPRPPKPAKSTGLSAQAGDAQVKLSWQDPNDSTIDKYQISEVIPEDFLTATGGAAGAHFGISVAIDGETAVVGADRANSRKGSVHIFTRNASGKWTQQAKLEGENTGDQFGWSVAVEGDTVVVGAHAYDGEDDEGNTLTNSGAIYVFTKPTSGGGWADTIAAPAKLTPTDPEAYAFFGGSVALDDNTLAIGSRLYDTEGYFSAGAAYVFTQTNGVWGQAAKLTASTSLQLAYLGYSLAVDGDTVLVGAYGDDTVRGELGSGSAYVFEKPSEGWTDGNETAKLTASDRQPSGYFGFSVALDGDTAVIGASQHSDPEIGAGSGAAYVFARESGVWGEKARLTPSDAAARDNFGVSVAVDGDTVVVGSWQDDDNSRNSGAAYVFEKPDLGWASTFETLKLTAPDGAANDRFGWSVAVDLDDVRGDLALVGAYSDDNAAALDAGSVHVLGIPDWEEIDPSGADTTAHTVTKVPDGTGNGPTLTNGNEYNFQIRALNRSGASPASDGVKATPLGVPAAPFLNAGAGDTQVTLAWSKPGTDGTIGPITGYKLSKDGGATFEDIDNSDIDDSDATNLVYTVTGLINLTSYTFQILAVNVIGEATSDESSATPSGKTPDEPETLEANPGDTQVQLTWDDPDDSSIDNYEYQWTGSNNTSSWGAGGTQDDWIMVPKLIGQTITHGVTVTGLTNGTTYTFNVRAVDNQASPAEGNPSSDSATPISSTPKILRGLTANVGDRQVRLTWDDPDDVSIDKYQYSTDDFTTSKDLALNDTDAISDPGTIRYTVTGLTNGTTYTFKVRAVDDEAVTPEGPAAEVNATPLPGQPREPKNLAARKGDSLVRLTWQHPDTTGAPITKYEFVHLLQTKPLYGEGEDKFGYAVAVDGDTAVIGAYQDDAMTPDVDESAVDSGAAYVFTRVEGVWEERVKLTASDGEAYDNFGISVAVSGDTIVIGASGDDGDGAADSGSVYVFLKPSAGWAGWKDLADDAKDALTAKLTASDAASLDYFGHSVAVSVDTDSETVLVGAYQDNDEVNDLEDSGSAYIFVKPTSNEGWTDATETAKLTPNDAADDDYFGTSVALDGDTAVIGAPEDDDNGIDSGSAYVFVKPDSGWTNTSTQTAKLTDSDGEAGDWFGVSVAVDNDTVVVGAYLDDREDDLTTPDIDETVVDAGSAYVFVKPLGTAWTTTNTPTAKLTPDDGEAGDYFGYSVAVDMDTVVVGAYWDDDNGDESGSAYVFTRDSLTRKWSQTNKLTAEDGEAGDWFGYSVAVDSPGHTALVGAGSAHLLDTHDWEEVPGGKDARTHIVDGLSNGRMYDFKVRGVNSFHQGPPAVGSATPGTGGSSLSANNNPEFNEGDNITRAVSENAPVRTPVGGPVTATDADDDTLEYSLFGEDRASFNLDRWTGQLTTKTSFDFEAQNEYSVRVEARDGEGGFEIINLTITVVDVDEPPSQPGTPQVFVAGPTGLTVGWKEPDNQGPAITGYDVQYREVGGQFRDAGYNGLGTSAALEGLIPATGYEVQVRAVNDEGVSPWSDSGRGETGEAEEGPVPTEPTIGSTPGPTLAPVTGPTPTVPPTGAGGPTPTAGSPTTTDQGPGFTPESTGAAVPTPMFDPVVKPIPIPQAAPIPESAPTVAPEPPSPVSQVTAPTPAPTPAAEPALSGADSEDGGFPWWIILVILIGIAAAILLIIWARRRRDRTR